MLISGCESLALCFSPHAPPAAPSRARLLVASIGICAIPGNASQTPSCESPLPPRQALGVTEKGGGKPRCAFCCIGQRGRKKEPSRAWPAVKPAYSPQISHRAVTTITQRATAPRRNSFTVQQARHGQESTKTAKQCRINYHKFSSV